MLGGGNALLHVADIRQAPMVAVVEYGDSGIDLIFQIRCNQLTQTHALAAYIAAIGHTGVEETQQPPVGVFHLADIMAFVALGIGVERFGSCGHIVAAEKVVDNLVAIGRIVERRFEYLAEGF